MLTFSLTLVRHGETQYNREKLLQGQGVDTPLSETGAQQGEAAGRYLKDIAFSNVFASNLQRAVQTAEIILRNNTHCSGMEMVLEPLLRERGFGVAEGRPKEDLKNMANAAGQSCRDYTPPGGETLDQKTSFLKAAEALRFKNSDPLQCRSSVQDNMQVHFYCALLSAQLILVQTQARSKPKKKFLHARIDKCSTLFICWRCHNSQIYGLVPVSMADRSLVSTTDCILLNRSNYRKENRPEIVHPSHRHPPPPS
ncbi:fructose-2,6-bisphosphatase TIGAR B isoform X2 [Lates calcarifer]|uniref:fructose-2,6-bisphosphate 2-phosphatase n=1 Tax=Lates calcarifer TaxID=8187 RepID=A0A4W6BZL6_LATCA|nr:fructose-2,6-bisphosphatase TIGAR B isoform X2 [Lates calcarifer]